MLSNQFSRSTDDSVFSSQLTLNLYDLFNHFIIILLYILTDIILLLIRGILFTSTFLLLLYFLKIILK